MKSLFLLLLISLPCIANAETIVVEAMGGTEATIIHSGARHPLKTEENIANDDKIETGKSTAIDLRLQNNSLVRVGVGSTVELKAGSLHLLAGSVRVLVPEQKEKSKKSEIRFRLITPEGSVGVRGTEFITDRINAATTVHTLRGEVLFGPGSDFSDLTKFAVVMKGYESTIKTGEHKVSTPKQFSIDSYLPSVTLQNFSALASREAGMQQARSSLATAQENPANDQKIAAQALSHTNKAASAATNAPASTAKANDQLIAAAATGDVAQLVAALQAGADPKAAVMPDSGDSILHIAAVNERLDATQYILDSVHIPVDYPNAKGQSALMLAASEANSQDIILLLLQNKASRTAKDRAGHSALDYAAGNPNAKAILNLLRTYSP